MSGYPEVKPEGVGSMESFKFSLAASDHAREDVGLRIEALETRLRRIEDKCMVTIQGQKAPLLANILGLNRNKAELKALAAGLDRAADLVEELDKLKAQEGVLEMAKADPNFFAWAFSDFDHAINDIDNYLKNELTSEG